MENLQLLLGKYEEDARVREVATSLGSDRPTHLHISGMVGAQAAFAFAGVYLNARLPVLYVAKTKEEASYFYDNLTRLLPQKPIWFFPDSSKRPGSYQDLNKHQILQRTETINKITGIEAASHMVVTYPEALAERVVAPQVLHKNRTCMA